MANHTIRTVQNKNNAYRIQIPRHVLQALGWTSGTLIAFTINADDTVTLTQIHPPPLHRNVAETRP